MSARFRDHADECAFWLILSFGCVGLASGCGGHVHTALVFTAGFSAGMLLRALHGGAP